MDGSSSALISFPVHAAGVEIGRATLSFPHPGPLHRGPFHPGSGIDRWPELFDRAMETAHKHPDSPLGVVLVDPRTAARVAQVVSLYGPASFGRDAWEIVVRFDTLSDGMRQTEGAA
jgi:hypothetical protein